MHLVSDPLVSDPGDLSLHHIGYVVDSIENRIANLAASLAARVVPGIFEDSIQRSRVAFLALPPWEPQSVQMELVQPASPDSPVTRFLDQGGGFHHLCYEVDHLEAQIKKMKAQHAVLIRSPKPAVAFGGRRIAWIRTAHDSLLIEYLERKLSGSAQKSGSGAGQKDAVVIGELET
jgi:methylmalonyl-CoA/ethylmalonyl-CoA epimerase